MEHNTLPTPKPYMLCLSKLYSCTVDSGAKPCSVCQSENPAAAEMAASKAQRIYSATNILQISLNIFYNKYLTNIIKYPLQQIFNKHHQISSATNIYIIKYLPSIKKGRAAGRTENGTELSKTTKNIPSQLYSWAYEVWIRKWTYLFCRCTHKW